MDHPAVSVVIVSRDRPEALTLCLTGVAQLDHSAFEVIVVACTRGAAAVRARADADQIKLLVFDQSNISAARNIGIAAAAGDIVAFIDDDAVPEPSWLRHLCAPFGDPAIAATGGYVRGRNGIGFQWTARSVDATGTAHPLLMASDTPEVPNAPSGHAVKTEGTNMAVRRDVLADMGGFDPAFRFYLDETDLNMRLAAAGHSTAIVPLAQVHHGYAPSARRNADRSPRDLTEIGASLAVFLRKHGDPATQATVWAQFRAEQRLRLLQHMQRGPLGADDVARLMHGLRKGWKAGLQRDITKPTPIPPAQDAFRPYPGRPGAPQVSIGGRVWQRAALRDTARAAVAQGQIVTIFRFSPTALYHRMTFHPDGFWEQTGGIFGRSDRTQRSLQITTLRKRIAREHRRLAAFRAFDRKI